MKNTFSIDRSQDPGKDSVFMIGIDDGFMDYELTYDDLVELGEAIKLAIKDENALRNKKIPIIFHEQLSGDVLRPDFNNSDPNSPFYEMKVVITGVFKTISREDLAELLKSLGADINTSISSRTNYVIAGDEAGPSKMEKVKSLISSGSHLSLLNESEFFAIVKVYRDSQF